MSEVTIYHNPKCGTSRNTLALIRNVGIEPQVIHYLETPPTSEELLRSKGEVYDELKLDDPKWTDDELVDILPQPQQGPFAKEDGEVVIGEQGRRLV